MAFHKTKAKPNMGSESLECMEFSEYPEAPDSVVFPLFPLVNHNDHPRDGAKKMGGICDNNLKKWVVNVTKSC